MIERQRYATHDATRVDTQTNVGLRRYMLRVYNLMSLGLALAGVIALFVSGRPEIIGLIMSPPLIYILFIGLLGLGMIAPRLILSGNLTTAHLAYWSYCGLWGLLIAPMFLVYTGDSIVRVFFITSIAFAGTSLYGYSTKRDLQPFGAFLSMASLGILAALIINIFIGSSVFSSILSIIVVLVFAGMTAFQTQSIRQSYYKGDSSIASESKAIFGAMLLFGSFVTMFVWMLAIFGQRR